MAITDLTGTTWYVPGDFTFNSTYGDFNIEGEATLATSTPTSYAFNRVVLGYHAIFSDATASLLGISDTYDTIKLYDGEESYTIFSGANGTFTGTNSTLTFTGGTDATNADLISWLSKWGELQEKKKPTKVFTRLYIGDTVATAGSKCFKRLTTEKVVEVKPYLTFSSPNSFTLATYNATKNWDGTLEYSTDTRTWNEWDGVTTLSADGGVLYMRGTGNTKITGSAVVTCRWVLGGTDIACEGNIENLLDYATVAGGEHPTMASHCFYCMFYRCASLTKAPDLLGTTMTEYCCYSMFASCTSLTTAPKLAATTMASGCYFTMFYGCTGLTTPPELPATTLASGCYYNMFGCCTGLTTLPKLTATTLNTTCYIDMFKGCTNIKLSATQTGEYQTEYRIPTSGTGTVGDRSLSGMFSGTGGTFTGTPSINTTYYTSNTVI